MRCPRCGGELTNVQGYRHCRECGHASNAALEGTDGRADADRSGLGVDRQDVL
ncbi:MAG: hypothetical protein ABEJ77_07715 [Halanaeroarchaeum sp.]